MQETEQAPAPEAEPCWMCSDPPHTYVPAQTKVLVHLKQEAVPMCFACAARAAVPGPPSLLAPASDTQLDSRGRRALVLEWTGVLVCACVCVCVCVCVRVCVCVCV